MAKQKQDNELDEEEIIDELEEDNEDDDESGEDDEKGKGKPDKKVEQNEEEAEVVEEDDEEDGSVTQNKSAEDEEALAAKRERRRREKKMRREREKRERMHQQNLIVNLQEQIRELREGVPEIFDRFGHLEKQSLTREMSDLAQVYNDAQSRMREAVKAGDGDAFVKAKEISDKAWHRYVTLESQAKQRPAHSQPRQQTQQAEPAQRTEQQQAQYSQRVTNLATKWARDNSSWYDPNGGNRESKVVLALDADLVSEGYDPEDQDYWDELTDRAKEILPHRFKRAAAPAQQQNRPRQTVGGAGGGSGGGTERTLPAEFVKTLRAAGYEKGSPQYKAAVKNYFAGQKQKA